MFPIFAMLGALAKGVGTVASKALALAGSGASNALGLAKDIGTGLIGKAPTANVAGMGNVLVKPNLGNMVGQGIGKAAPLALGMMTQRQQGASPMAATMGGIGQGLQSMQSNNAPMMQAPIAHATAESPDKMTQNFSASPLQFMTPDKIEYIRRLRQQQQMEQQVI